MRAGKLDRRITIQSKSTAQDASGDPIETWSNFLTVWSERMMPRGTEAFKAEQELATRNAVFRIRHVAGINEQMRIVDEGTTYLIKAIADDYRKRFIEMTAEAFNPQDSGS